MLDAFDHSLGSAAVGEFSGLVTGEVVEAVFVMLEPYLFCV